MLFEILDYFLLWTTAPNNRQIWTTGSKTLSQRRSLSYRNKSIDLQSKSMGWFLYDWNLRYERVKGCQLSSYKLKWHWWCRHHKIMWLWENAIIPFQQDRLLPHLKSRKTQKNQLIVLYGYLYLFSLFFYPVIVIYLLLIRNWH